jgi:hypothetical protein
MPLPLIIDGEAREQIETLRALALANPVDMRVLMKRIHVPQCKAQHMAQMTRQTISIPLGFRVTFSIEHGHPAGTCRHMSVSTAAEGEVPGPHAVWMIAQELGFWGSLHDCTGIWKENLRGHGLAINVVQTLAPPTNAEENHHP